MSSELETLRNRLARLEELLGLGVTFPPSLGLTGREQDVLGVLLSREIATRDMLMYVLFGDDPNGDGSPNNASVHVSRLRRKLPVDVAIQTSWGRGYYLNQESKRRLRALIGQQRELAA